MTRELGYMDLELYQKVIDEVAGYAAPVRDKEIELFHFGESLLHPQIDEMVGYASDHGLKTMLSVNAPHLRPELAERILARRPHRLVVSMDGYDEESFRAIRGPAANYDRACRNTEQLIRIHREIRSEAILSLRMIRLRANLERSADFKREWEAKGISVELREFFPWSDESMSGLGEYQKFPPKMPCPFPWQYLVVQWNGDVVPCCRDYNGVNVVGNVADKSLKEIWNGPAEHRIREQLRTGDYDDNELCRACMALYYDDGPTPSEAGP